MDNPKPSYLLVVHFGPPDPFPHGAVKPVSAAIMRLISEQFPGAVCVDLSEAVPYLFLGNNPVDPPEDRAGSAAELAAWWSDR